MSRLRPAIRTLTLILTACLAGPVIARDDAHTEKAVLETVRRACQAYERGDVEAMKELFTEDFTLTNSSGTVTTRADDIELARNGAVEYAVFRKENMKARLHGDAAVVTGRTIVKGRSGRNAFDAEFRFTDMLVFEHGRWRVAASHVSLLKSDVEQAPTDLKR